MAGFKTISTSGGRLCDCENQWIVCSSMVGRRGGGGVPAAMVATVAWINQELFNKPATNELCAVPPLIWSENE